MVNASALRRTANQLMPVALAGFVLATAQSAFASVQASDGADALTNSAKELSPEEAAIRAHVAYLASDALRGRKPGTPGYDKAADYVVQQMQAAGLQPGGQHHSWYQKVPLVETRSSGTPKMTINGQPLIFNTDFATWPTPGLPGVKLDAAVVFAGYGVVDSATGRNDYLGLDVRGKIVALFMTGPKGENSEVAAHQAYVVDRARIAQARGAVGIILLHTKSLEALAPFAFLKDALASNQATWNDGSQIRELGAPRIGLLSASGATKLFAHSGTSWDSIRAAEDAGQPVTVGPLKVRLATLQQYETVHLSSANVLGKLAGNDSNLARETIVVSAHLDHVGTVPEVNGDDIAHGALDNAMGVAVILEAAKLFQANGDHPKRSILFLALTAEESGLTGSDYFTQHASMAKSHIVADINVDCPVLTYRFQDLVAVGAERSSIGPIAKAVIDAERLQLTPDPMPEQLFFIRSDQYSFVRIGVPSIFLFPGLEGPGRDAQADYFTHHYHQPSDDMALPIDWTAARRFVNINYQIAHALSDAPDRPRWVNGDYFGRRFHGAMLQ